MQGLEQSLLEEIDAFARRLAAEAGEILLERFGKPLDVQFKEKDRTAPVTDVDKRVEQHLRAAIKQRFLDHQIVGEEGEDTPPQGSGFAWVLDPLDGTTNYLNGLPVFGSSIGVLYEGRPVVGSIYVPTSSFQEAGVYHGRLGGGAFFEERPIRVESTDVPQRSRLSGMPAHFAFVFNLALPLRQHLGEVRSLGSISYEIGLVASGVFQYAVFGGPKIWDIAAGVIIVREAGGEALTRRWRKGDWRPLDAFEPMAGRGRNSQPALRNWGASLVIGNPAIARFVAAGARRRWRPLRRIMAMARRWLVGPGSAPSRGA
ncbi:MAG: inositol monophosphatase [Chloroflexi bacterium]|nr:inositol monophosphatase [Chloroflexota bacterium]